MDLAVVCKEVERWEPEEQDRLSAHLAALRQQRSTKLVQELDRRIEDRSPKNWLSLDQLKSKLAEGSPSS